MKLETRTFVRILLVVNNIILIVVTGASLDFLFGISTPVDPLYFGAAAAAVTGIVTGYAAIFRFMYKEYMDNIVKLSGLHDETTYEMAGTLIKKD